MFCIRKNFFSHRKNNLLFLPCNMAAVQNLYSERSGFLLVEHCTHRFWNVSNSINNYYYRKENHLGTF